MHHMTEPGQTQELCASLWFVLTTLSSERVVKHAACKAGSPPIYPSVCDKDEGMPGDL